MTVQSDRRVAMDKIQASEKPDANGAGIFAFRAKTARAHKRAREVPNCNDKTCIAKSRENQDS